MTVDCLRSKFGYCRLGNMCKNTHYSELCDKTGCTGTKCNKRHPVPCFYFNRFGRCKFGEFCAYRHNKTKEQVLKEDIEILKNVVNDMKKELHESKQSDKSFSCDICDQVYTTEKKLRQHKTKKHEDLDKTMEESEWSEIVEKVKNLGNKVMLLEDKAEDTVCKTEYTSVELSDISEKFDVLVKIVEEQDGLISKLESEVNFLLFEEKPELIKCDICGEECYWKMDMIHHRATKHRDIAIQNGEIQIGETSSDILVLDLRTKEWKRIDSQHLCLCLP